MTDSAQRRLTPPKKARRWEALYMATVMLLIFLVVGVPFLIRRGVAMADHVFIEQEVLQALLIAVLLCVA